VQQLKVSLQAARDKLARNQPSPPARINLGLPQLRGPAAAVTT